MNSLHIRLRPLTQREPLGWAAYSGDFAAHAPTQSEAVLGLLFLLQDLDGGVEVEVLPAVGDRLDPPEDPRLRRARRHRKATRRIGGAA